MDDPSIDEEEIDALRGKASGTSDPIERLRILAEIAKATAPRGDDLVKAFLANAKDYAESQGFPLDVYADFGVPADVVSRIAKPKRNAGPSSGATASVIRTAALETGSFTVKGLCESTGASAGTVNRVITDLVAENVLTISAQEVPSGRRGRAPKLYTVRSV